MYSFQIRPAIDLLSPDSFNSHIPSCCILPVLKQRDKQQILIQHRKNTKKNMKPGTFPQNLYKNKQSTINIIEKSHCSPTKKKCVSSVGPSPWRHDVFEECCFQKLRSYDHGHRHHGHWNLGPLEAFKRKPTPQVNPTKIGKDAPWSLEKVILLDSANGLVNWSWKKWGFPVWWKGLLTLVPLRIPDHQPPKPPSYRYLIDPPKTKSHVGHDRIVTKW